MSTSTQTSTQTNSDEKLYSAYKILDSGEKDYFMTYWPLWIVNKYITQANIDKKLLVVIEYKCTRTELKKHFPNMI